MKMGSTCDECRKEARIWEEDGTGYCWGCGAEYCQDQAEKEDEEKRTGISEFEIAMRAKDKVIPFAQAKKELLAERAEEHEAGEQK